MRILLSLLPLGLLLACGADPSSSQSDAAHGGKPPSALALEVGAEDSAPPPASDLTPPADTRPDLGPQDTAAVERAKVAMRQFRGALKGTLQSAMKTKGPVAALGLCSSEAQPLTSGHSQRSGTLLGRSSLRLRNAQNRGPAWVTEWLEAQGERKAEGVTSSVRFATDKSGHRVARLIAPLPVKPPCLICHGPSETLALPLREAIASNYPQDQATGYALGDLRGALWAEARVEAAPEASPGTP